MGRKLILPFKLGLKSGFNGNNVYDANDDIVCSLFLPLHQTIRQIREFAETSERTKKDLEIADFIVEACNSYDALKSQKAALLAACNYALSVIGSIPDACRITIEDELDEDIDTTLIQSAIEQAGEGGE